MGWPTASSRGGHAQENSAPRGAVPPARLRSVNNRGPTQAGSTPNCLCDIPAQELAVVKESANKGRKFWTCGHHPEKKCLYFDWMTGTSASTTQSGSDADGFTRPVVPAKRPLVRIRQVVSSLILDGPIFQPIQAPSGNRSPDVPPRCQCNQLAESRTVQKEGPNKGRTFWSCPKSQGAACKFFAWADEAGLSNSGVGPNNASAGSRGECFKW